MLDPIEEKYDLPVEAYKEGEVLAPEVLNERVDISFENSPRNPILRSFEHQLDSSLEEGNFG